MSYPVTSIDRAADAFVLGLSIRTAKEAAQRDIPGLWARLWGEGWLARLPAPEDGALYAVYTDYHSDDRGPYTMVLGVKVRRDVAVPGDLRRVVIPAGEHAVLRVEGDPRVVVLEAWGEINGGAFDGRGRRRFSADFERYELATLRPDHAKIEIAVGLSP
jgi:predicted transcriptional regulator YdeE